MNRVNAAPDPDPSLLGIYLNDHLAGATGGLDLFRRAARNHAQTAAGPVLARLAGDVAQDRDALLAVMASLGVPARSYKVAAGWLAEKAGRLKPNGRLTSRSPLSSVVELEALKIGVAAKEAAWRLLRPLADIEARLDAADLDRLIDRAQRQGEEVEALRVAAAVEAFRERPA